MLPEAPAQGLDGVAARVQQNRAQQEAQRPPAAEAHDPVAAAMESITTKTTNADAHGAPPSPGTTPPASQNLSMEGIRPRAPEGTSETAAPGTMLSLEEVREKHAPQKAKKTTTAPDAGAVVEMEHLSSVREDAMQPRAPGPPTLEERIAQARAKMPSANDNNPPGTVMSSGQPIATAETPAHADTTEPNPDWMHGMSDAMSALIDKAEADAQRTGAPRTRIADPIDMPALQRELDKEVQKLNHASQTQSPEEGVKSSQKPRPPKQAPIARPQTTQPHKAARMPTDAPMILDTDPRVKKMKKDLNDGTLTRENYYKKIRTMQQEKANSLARGIQPGDTVSKENTPSESTRTAQPEVVRALETHDTTPEVREIPEMPNGIPFAQFAFPPEFKNTIHDAIEASGAPIDDNEAMDILDALADAVLKGDSAKFARQQHTLEALCTGVKNADGTALHEMLVLLVHRELLRDAAARVQHRNTTPTPLPQEVTPPVPQSAERTERRDDAPRTAQELIEAARGVYRSRAEGADAALVQFVDQSLARAQERGKEEGATLAFKTILTGVALNAVVLGTAGAAAAAYVGIVGVAAIGAVGAATALTGGAAGLVVAGAALGVRLRSKARS